MQTVPTGVVKGPHGDYFMSQLTGFPFPVGAANVYRVDRKTGAAEIFASGFTNIMDLAFDEGRHSLGPGDRPRQPPHPHWAEQRRRDLRDP